MLIRRWLSFFAFFALIVGGLAPAASADNPHRVGRGDTLSGIAARHDSSVRKIVRLNPKKIKNRNTIFPGQRLKVHGKAKANPKRKPGKSRNRRERVRCHRVWPVPGRTVYTYPGHNGVDVNRGSGWDDHGDPIRAAACGTITYVGWNRGYGDAIFQRVKSGREVVYGHTSEQYVHSGERVRAGELIGRVGTTGNSTAPHLHFCFTSGGTYQNALDFLLGGGAGGLSRFIREETIQSLTVQQLAAFDGSGIAVELAIPSEPRTEAPWSVHWRDIARCESSLRWHINTGNGYYGGLQFLPATWREHGGRQFAYWPHRAARKEQKIVAERVLHGVQGLGAWPVCGVRGL
jgi:LysM repeat protein